MLTDKELLALVAASVYNHEDQSTDIAISIAEQIIAAAEEATAFKPAESPADRERRGDEARKQLVRRGATSRPTVEDVELPF
jgi:hypothetical protein